MFHLVSKVFFFTVRAPFGTGSPNKRLLFGCIVPSVRQRSTEQKASVRLHSAEHKASVRHTAAEQKASVRHSAAEQKPSRAKSRAVLNFVPNRSSDSLILGDKLFYM